MKERVREPWIDVLRSLAMIFVVVGHMISGMGFTGYYTVTSPVKIPLFFAVSGYLFNDRKGDGKAFFLNLWKTLIVPFIAFSLLLFPVKYTAAVLGLINHLPHEVLVSFLTGDELWFFPCLIVAEIIFFFVLKYAKKAEQVIPACLLLAALGYFMLSRDLFTFANINTAFFAQYFFIIGYCMKRFGASISRKNLFASLLLIAYAVLCGLSFRLYPGKCLDVHRNLYYAPILNLSMIGIGIISLFLLLQSFRLKKMGALAYIGQNTIVIYVLHEYVIAGLEFIFKHLYLSNSWFSLLLVFFGTFLLTVPAAKIISRWFPFLIGKPKRK